MAIDKKQQIRGIRILLTVFYGFLLSSILFRYLVHGIIDTIRSPRNPYAISLIVIGGLILISIGLAIYATWSAIRLTERRWHIFLSFRFDNTAIMLVSGVVLIFVFILTLVFGILRILKATPHRAITETGVRGDSSGLDEGSGGVVVKENMRLTDSHALAEDVTGLIIELISILFAILGTFVLFRYVKVKYSPVATREPAAAS